MCCMYLYSLLQIVQSFLLFLIYESFQTIKISFITGCQFSQFTFFEALLPGIFTTSAIGKIFVLYRLFSKNILYKLPSISSLCSFSLLKTYNNKITKIILLIIFFANTFLFSFFFQNTIIYTIPWLICILYIAISFKKKYNQFESLLLSHWIAQSTGSVCYGILNGFLSKATYLNLLPISILERILFASLGAIFIYLIKIADSRIEIVSKKITLYFLKN